MAKDFENDIKNIKSKINNIQLDDEFKENLENKMKIEYSKKTKVKNIDIFNFPKQIVAACLCLVVLSSCVFAEQIGDLVTNLFANTSPNIEEILENGDLQKVDMDYIEKDGISMKVDYVLFSDNSIYLVFNILSNEEFDYIYFEDLFIKDQSGEIIYNIAKDNNEKNRFNTKYSKKRLSKNNEIIIMKIDNKLSKNEVRNISISINEISYTINNNTEKIKNNWIFNINNEKAQSHED